MSEDHMTAAEAAALDDCIHSERWLVCKKARWCDVCFLPSIVAVIRRVHYIYADGGAMSERAAFYCTSHGWVR